MFAGGILGKLLHKEVIAGSENESTFTLLGAGVGTVGADFIGIKGAGKQLMQGGGAYLAGKWSESELFDNNGNNNNGVDLI